MDCDINRAEQERDCGRGGRGGTDSFCLQDTVGEKWDRSHYIVMANRKGTQSGIIGSKLWLPHGPESVSHLWNRMAHILLVCITHSVKWQASIHIMHFVLLLTWCLNTVLLFYLFLLCLYFHPQLHQVCDVKWNLCAYPLLLMLNCLTIFGCLPKKQIKLLKPVTPTFL